MQCSDVINIIATEAWLYFCLIFGRREVMYKTTPREAFVKEFLLFLGGVKEIKEGEVDFNFAYKYKYVCVCVCKFKPACLNTYRNCRQFISSQVSVE